MVGAAYVGTNSRNLPFARDINYPVLNPTATSAGANILARRPNPLFGAVLLLQSDQTADYHGLQITAATSVSLAKRLVNFGLKSVNTPSRS